MILALGDPSIKNGINFQKLKEEIKLWENNLGFLANSKQADILKAEFEKKMENARKEIALEEAKLKMIDQAAEKTN